MVETIGMLALWLAYIIGTGCCAFMAVVLYRWLRLQWATFAEAAAEERRQYRAQQMWRLRVASETRQQARRRVR